MSAAASSTPAAATAPATATATATLSATARALRRSRDERPRHRFRPMNAGRWIVWGGFALMLLVAPRIWSSGFGLTMLSQIGIAIIACLAYNILLGQGGMLSFGHAVYSGLGSFVAIHALNAAGDGRIVLPVSLVPIVGGLAGLVFAALLGGVSTRKSGTTFAMITLGIGELVASMSLMLPEFFGGEGGISGNRVQGRPLLGITFGPQVELYHLIAVYCFVCTAAMYALTRTPLGRMLNAVRDNPERVEFVGYSTRHVRWIAFIVSGFFSGVAGGLAALNFELVTAEVVGAARSGAYLLFVFLGGATFFIGPIIGAVLMVVALVLLSELTKAWLLYLGLAFVFMVMYAPGGIAGLIMMNLRLASFGKLGAIAGSYLALAGTALAALLGAGAIVEMIYHLKLNEGLGPQVSFLGVTMDASRPDAWVGAVFVMLTGIGLFELVRRRFVAQWGRTQEDIEIEVKKREALA